MKWHVGMKVVCVDASLRHYDGEKWIAADTIYTIREIVMRRDGRPGFRLIEVVNAPRHYRGGVFGEATFDCLRFRPAVSPHADISVFERILADVNAREAVEA